MSIYWLAPIGTLLCQGVRILKLKNIYIYFGCHTIEFSTGRILPVLYGNSLILQMHKKDYKLPEVKSL